MDVLKFGVEGLNKGNIEAFEQKLRELSGVHTVETNAARGLARVLSDRVIGLEEVAKQLADSPFRVVTPPAQSLCLSIDGMSCQSCEIRIEKRLKGIAGVEKVSVDSTTGIADVTWSGEAPATELMAQALQEEGYRFKEAAAPTDATRESTSMLSIVGFLALAYIVGSMLSRFGLIEKGFSFNDSTTFASAFMVGLVAASSSCIAVAGGVMLSSVTAWASAHQGAPIAKKTVPVGLFILGRLASYGLLGALIGFVGKSLQLSPFVMGMISVLAALYMIVAGLDMLGVAPGFLKRLLPRMPKALGHRVLRAENSQTMFAPFLLGAATFFLPCGFTQALQLYALTTGSAMRSGMLLFAFALGTAPLLVAIGFAASSVKGKTASFFYRFAGAAVFLLGLSTVGNGFTAAGIALPHLEWERASEVSDATDPNVIFDGTKQVIRMKIGIEPAYTPSDQYTVKLGVPVRMEISGVGTGCRSIFQIPRLGVRASLDRDLNVVEFTPQKEGDAVFSCSMGMFPGTLHVVKS